jgi:hypothetical protein
VQSARQNYLAESERARQAALAATRRLKHNLEADGASSQRPMPVP